MNTNADRLIENLTPAIAEKCEEIRTARRNKVGSVLFAIICAAVLVLPAMLVFFGVSLTILIAPILFMSLCVVGLLPVLLTGRRAEHGGKNYERS